MTKTIVKPQNLKFLDEREARENYLNLVSKNAGRLVDNAGKKFRLTFIRPPYQEQSERKIAKFSVTNFDPFTRSDYSQITFNFEIGARANSTNYYRDLFFDLLLSERECDGFGPVAMRVQDENRKFISTYWVVFLSMKHEVVYREKRKILFSFLVNATLKTRKVTSYAK